MKCCLFWNWWMLQQSKNMELMNNLNFNWDLLSYFKVILLRNKIWLISFVLYCQISCQNVLQLVMKKRMDKWTWRQTVHLINTGSSSKRLLLPIIHFDWFSHTHTHWEIVQEFCYWMKWKWYMINVLILSLKH